jgi:peptidoglycan/LPS O-acetylase OafA/YrhL
MDPTLWSISLEVLCYILLPFLLWPLWRGGRTREPRRVARYLALVLIGLQVAHFVIVGAFMTDRVDKGWAYGMIGGAKEWLPYWSPASFMTQFMLGSCAAFAIAWRTRNPRPIATDEHDQMALWALVAAGFVFAFLGQMGVPSLLTRQPYITPILPALVALLLYHLHFSARMAEVLDNRIFRYVSSISFGVYLWHWPVMELLRIYAVPTFRMFGVTSGTTWLLLAATVLGLSCLLASLSWHCLEQPILRCARRGEDAPSNPRGQSGFSTG